MADVAAAEVPMADVANTSCKVNPDGEQFELAPRREVAALTANMMAGANPAPKPWDLASWPIPAMVWQQAKPYWVPAHKPYLQCLLAGAGCELEHDGRCSRC